MNRLPPFILYGLVGCQHCIQAENFLRVKGVPCFFIIANDDPIAHVGIKIVTRQENYPVLVYRPTKEIVIGFKEREYGQLVETYFTFLRASASGKFDSQQQSAEQNQVAATS